MATSGTFSFQRRKTWVGCFFFGVAGSFLFPHPDSKPDRVSLALLLQAALAGSLAARPVHAYQLLCLLRMGTCLPLPLRKQENMFCQWQGGVGSPLWLQDGPPAGPPMGRQPVVVGV
jgi:hypothetical protein